MGSAMQGLMGLGTGAGGTGFAPPQAAGIQNPVTADQINQSYTDVQSGLASQQQLLQALQAQQGIQNQSDVYNQLQGVANGTGPNPAQAMLNQATGQNVANQAALMAGQRGAGSNVGLMARQAAQQGAATQQQAAGQGATMQANQSLNALGQLGGLSTQQVQQQVGATQGLSQAQMAEQQQLLGAQQAYNAAAVGSQSSINNANAEFVNTRLQGQTGALGGMAQGAASGLAALGALAAAAEGGEVVTYSDGGGVSNPSPSSASSTDSNPSNSSSGPSSFFGKYLAQLQKQQAANNQSANSTMQQGNLSFTGGVQGLSNGMSSATSSGITGITGGISGLLGGGGGGAMGGSAGGGGAGLNSGAAGMSAAMMAKGGRVPALVSPGEIYLSPEKVEKVKKGANPVDVGEKIKGKPRVPGAVNSYKNDTIPKTLEGGGIVVPNKETKSKTPRTDSAKFVASILAKRKSRG